MDFTSVAAIICAMIVGIGRGFCISMEGGVKKCAEMELWCRISVMMVTVRMAMGAAVCVQFRRGTAAGNRAGATAGAIAYLSSGTSTASSVKINSPYKYPAPNSNSALFLHLSPASSTPLLYAQKPTLSTPTQCPTANF